MFKRIANSVVAFFREETLKERSERMLPGALFGVVAGTAYVLTISLINVFCLPALHLSVDWPRMLTNLVKFDLVLGLVGLLAGWFTDHYMGAIGGGIVTILVYLLVNWIILRFSGASPEKMAQLFITAVPLLIGAMVLCGIFRYAVNWYARVNQIKPGGKRRSRLVGFVVIILVAGMFPGLFSLFDHNTQNVIMTMDKRLQAVSSDPTLISQFPLVEFPDLQAHFGRPFVLHPRASTAMADALDVTIRYEDGYAITCLVSTVDPYVQYFKQCYAGNNVKLP